MAGVSIPGPPARGRPRSQHARLAILQATAELLADNGPDTVSVDAIARRAGVSKATIYRWWPSKEAVALDALLAELSRRERHPPETGAIAVDLAAQVQARSRTLATHPWVGRTMVALVAQAWNDPRLREAYHTRVFAPLRQPARRLLKQAVQRGELPAATNIDMALDLIYGPLHHRLFQGHAPLTRRFARSIVDTVLTGLGHVGSDTSAP